MDFLDNGSYMVSISIFHELKFLVLVIIIYFPGSPNSSRPFIFLNKFKFSWFFLQLCEEDEIT